MIELKEDLFKHLFDDGHIVAISTNGFIRRDGRAVMGRGCALDAAIAYPEFPDVLGKHIKEFGNVPCYITVGHADGGRRFMVLPVKHKWMQEADLGLIEHSVRFLGSEATELPGMVFHVPRLGCGNGRLDWETRVRPLMQSLPDNVLVHH